MNDRTKNPERPDGGLAKSHDRIGDQLRRLYDDVANEPIPEEFLKLLEEADTDPEDADRKDGEGA
ncbi:MAG: RNA polymerase subunit sigma-70 [Alphaproteobacteria bacterium]|nr:RNA polymerase subunit sigma-70 [Alphaproteobacteria bacterium]